MIRRDFLFSTLFALTPIASVAQASDLKIVGSGDGMEMLQAVAADYAASHPGKSVIIPPSIGTGGGFTAVNTEREVMGRIARELSDAEKAQGLVATPLVHVPIAIFAHPSAGVKALTAAQVIDIFTGKIRNWSEIGGRDQVVRVVRRDLNDSTLVALRATMPGWKDLVFTDRAKQTLSTTEMLETVRTTEGAIGFCPYAKPIEGVVTYMKIDGVAPSEPAYKSHVLLNLLHKANTVTDDAKAFIAFIRTDRAKVVLKSVGGKTE